MRNKIIVALCTVALLLGVMPLCISASIPDLTDYKEFYIPSPELTLPFNGEELYLPIGDSRIPFLFHHSQSLAWGTYKEININAIPTNMIINADLSFEGVTLEDCNGFYCDAEIIITKNDDSLLTFNEVLVFVKTQYFNYYTQRNEVNYLILIDGAIGEYPILISNQNFRNSLPMQYLILTQDYVVKNTNIFLRDEIWEEFQNISDQNLFNWVEYLMRESPTIHDKYFVRDYTHAMNDILESAQTGIASWTSNPLILTILCIVMGICIITVLWKFISIKMRGGF